MLNKPKWDTPDSGLNYDTFMTDPDGTRTLDDNEFMVITDTTGSMRQARVAIRFSY